MDADDARLVRIYTAETGTFLANTTPNAATPTAATNFDVVIEGDAGNVKGTSGQAYNLSFIAQELTIGGGAAAAYSGSAAQHFDNLSGWTPAGVDFKNVWQRTIPVTAADRGRVFQYTASLVTANNDVVSFVQSEPFLIV